jgi:hypothetical protein
VVRGCCRINDFGRVLQYERRSQSEPSRNYAPRITGQLDRFRFQHILAFPDVLYCRFRVGLEGDAPFAQRGFEKLEAGTVKEVRKAGPKEDV